MKKIIAMLLALVLCCAGLTALAETETVTEQKTLVGIWVVDRIAMDGENFQTVAEMMSGMNVTMFYEFTEDGVMKAWGTLDGQEISRQEGTYVVDGNTLTVVMDGTEETDELRFEGDELWIVESAGGAIIVMVPFVAE